MADSPTHTEQIREALGWLPRDHDGVIARDALAALDVVEAQLKALRRQERDQADVRASRYAAECGARLRRIGQAEEEIDSLANELTAAEDRVKALEEALRYIEIQSAEEWVSDYARAALVGLPEERVTHGRHCPCSACAREDWTRITAPCGMHGPDCPAVYAPSRLPEEQQ